MAGKKNTTSKDKCCAPSTSAGEEEIDVKKDLRDILRCGACELIFFNLDDFVAHKSEDCQASKVKSSSDDSDVEVIRHSPNPPVDNGKDQRGAHRDPHVLVQREGSHHRQPRHVPAPGRRKDDQETQSDSRRVPAQSSNPEPLEVDVKLYKAGYTVDDGPLREYTDPQNREFLASIFKREMPAEFIYKGNSDIFINLHHCNEENSSEKKFLEYLVGNRFKLRNNSTMMKKTYYDEKAKKDAELRWKPVMKQNSSYNEIKKENLKEKIYASIDGQEKSAKCPEIEVNSENSNSKKNDLYETEILKIKYRNDARSLARQKEKQSAEIERLKVKTASTELKRTDTARQMVIEKNRNSEIKLHNERRELYALQKINDIEESIKRR